MDDPLERFTRWYAEAAEAEGREPNAAALATVGEDGAPSVRMVLVKRFDAQGFDFFTNLQSLKARQLLSTRAAALCFHWPAADRQVRVSGTAAQLSDAECDAYFATRPRTAQLSAWASKQSSPLESREALLKRVQDAQARFGDGPVPRPPHWGGFRLRPTTLDFWRGDDDRLHHRDTFVKNGAGWLNVLINP
ncbi:MAG: pyridoxamine 5'-phosphate oxidase [Myxococcaceae bacterium]|nr:pyridoxamine 5'-phosphate oxidase [Myxococcaceae bacterium]